MEDNSSSETNDLLNKSSQLTDYAKSILIEAESQNSEIDRANNLFKHSLNGLKKGLNIIGIMDEKDFSLFLYLGAGTIIYIFILFYWLL